MKILFPVQIFYPSSSGGTALSVYLLTKHLNKNGFEPIIISTDQGLPPEIPRNKWLEMPAGRVIFIKADWVYFSLRQYLTIIKTMPEADAVHLSSIYFPPSILSAIYSILLRKKLIVSPRNEFSNYSMNRSRFKKIPVIILYKFFIKHFARFHATSEKEANEIRLQLGRKVSISTISNLVEIQSPIAKTKCDYMLFLGRIDHLKGIELLLEALGLSNAFKASKTRLKIAGSGNEKYLSSLIRLRDSLGLKEKVEFVGHISGDEKRRLFANASWTIVPSIDENFNMVVLESLLEATPVIASKGVPWESLEKYKAGFWVERSAEKFAEIIDKALRIQGQEYGEYCENAKRLAQEFDIEKHFQKWLDFYNQAKG
jgi:glycosyltransferase involved in cell wall biosynthesis